MSLSWERSWREVVGNQIQALLDAANFSRSASFGLVLAVRGKKTFVA